MTPTDEQYKMFGEAVSGILDAKTSEPEAISDKIVVSVIMVAAQTYGITFKGES